MADSRDVADGPYDAISSIGMFEHVGRAFLALVGTAGTTVVWFSEARRSRLDVLRTWPFFTPVVGIVLAAVLLRDRPAGWTAAGLATVLVAMCIALRPPCRPPGPSEATDRPAEQDPESHPAPGRGPNAEPVPTGGVS